MTLDEFRRSENMTYDDLTKFLNIPRNRVYSICTGIHRIALKDAYIIKVRTRGAVSYNDLLLQEGATCR